jgi:hypothetical protein
MRPFLLLSFFLSFQTFHFCQDYSNKDIEVCNSKFKLAASENLDKKEFGNIITVLGKSFIGTNYLAAALEKDGEEKLVVNLTGLDCTTFVENVIVFARLVKTDSASFSKYLKELAFVRYRNGIIDSYTSRLHYFSDWIYNNIQKNVVKDVTRELGGIPVKFEINYMSAHPDLYKHLKENPSFIPVIKTQEDSINSRTYYYIPKNKVSLIEKDIHDGDIIAFTTSVKGLDIGHVGIAVNEKDGRIYLLHSPQPNTKVHITKEPLAEYIMNVKKHSGIIVLRALDP